MKRENISVFDMLKIGIGPSSSHTMGPWLAAKKFVAQVQLDHCQLIYVDLFGSLALTGKGHGTDKAIILGLMSYDPATILQHLVFEEIEHVASTHQLKLSAQTTIQFNPEKDIRFHMDQSLDFHPNGITFYACDASKNIIHKETYFSIGGGFVVQENQDIRITVEEHKLPFPIDTADDIKRHCSQQNFSISELVMSNECSWDSKEIVHQKVLNIWATMLETIYRGCHTHGMLPGGLDVSRRASTIYDRLKSDERQYTNATEWLSYLKTTDKAFSKTLKFISSFAISTNEENANFGRVVTAPTNGAAGVIPAVLMYYILFSERVDVDDDGIVDFLLVASEIGAIFKKQSTISAALGGCQAEIGVSSAMAAAALTHGLGGTTEQTLMAAEIAMEHHLGLTCDPIGGLVQIPCIERNSMGAIKAITASQIALESNPQHAKVSLDTVIKTMHETALDMNTKYKETSLGGLANQVSVSVSEC